MIPHIRLPDFNEPIRSFGFEDRQNDLAWVGALLMVASCVMTGTVVWAIVHFMQQAFAQ